MKIERCPFVPFAAIGGLEAFMADKKYYARQSGPLWDGVSWENGELVCDQVILSDGETRDDIMAMFET